MTNAELRTRFVRDLCAVTGRPEALPTTDHEAACLVREHLRGWLRRKQKSGHLVIGWFEDGSCYIANHPLAMVRNQYIGKGPDENAALVAACDAVMEIHT